MATNKPHKKVRRNQASKKYSLKKTITHIKLSFANDGKLEKLDEVAVEFRRVVQHFCDWLIAGGSTEPDKNAPIPEIETHLSARWQRCAWRQACGIVQSWFSNERTHPPVLNALSIQADANVAKLEKSATGTFDYWVKLATLEKGSPVLLPVKLYKKAAETIQKYPHLCTGVRLDQVDGQWFLTLVVGKEYRKNNPGGVVGVDIGMKAMVVTSAGGQFGAISPKLRQRVEKSKEKRARKQRLNVCLKKKGLPTVSLADNRTERYVRNKAGRAINQMLAGLPEGAAVALERLSVKDMRFKSREMNRWLRASQLGFIRDRLKFKLDMADIRYRSVQAAYSSQQCSQCGYTDRRNRPDQAHFHCLHCGFTSNADDNAARNIAKRFSDDELNRCPYKNVKVLLDQRFQQNLPVARSATAGRDTKGVVGQSVQLTLMTEMSI